MFWVSGKDVNTIFEKGAAILFPKPEYTFCSCM